MTRRLFCSALAAAAAGGLLGCTSDGHLSVFGYTTRPPFDATIRSVYIPTFKLAPIVTNPFRGMDVNLTEAVVEELNARKCPIKVVSDPTRADTILIGTIQYVGKNTNSYNQQALPLEQDVVIGVDVVWRDQRSGEVLSNPKAKKPDSGLGPFDPTAQATPAIPADVNAAAVRITATGRVLIQNGESSATGADAAQKKLARLIVNMMEEPWQVK